jgi:hypothetical protein
MVIGSQSPWVEAMALFHGAAKIITAEYAPLDIQVPTLEYVHPTQLVKNWEKYGEKLNTFTPIQLVINWKSNVMKLCKKHNKTKTKVNMINDGKTVQ